MPTKSNEALRRVAWDLENVGNLLPTLLLIMLG